MMQCPRHRRVTLTITMRLSSARVSEPRFSEDDLHESLYAATRWSGRL
jgi:hypothetical protein